MARDRQSQGFIWGKGILQYANPAHYRNALDSDDLRDEEYWAQSVFHGPSHANNLTHEIFHKKLRNKVTNKVEIETLVSGVNADIVNDVRSNERRNGVVYSRVVEDTKVVDNRDQFPESKVGIGLIIDDVSKKCNDDEIKVLAYFIVLENIDQILFDTDSFRMNADPRIVLAIEEIQMKNIININALNSYVGTKYRADNARRSLCTMIKKEFPALMVCQ